MNEIKAFSEHDVTFTSAMVNFNEFEYYKAQCEKVAEYISSLVLTDDNVKDVKKDLAAARKITDALNSKRIEVKKIILTDYMTFEAQVKELQNIIKGAEDSLRSKVRELEEEERSQKKEQIKAIWGKRWQMCGLSQYLDCDKVFEEYWLKPQHLNKSTSIKAVEKDMTAWMDSTDKDLETVESMDDEYLVEYLSCLDLAESIKAINFRKGIKAEVERVSGVDDMEAEVTAAFIITGDKDIKLTELLLKENEIDYIRR